MPPAALRQFGLQGARQSTGSKARVLAPREPAKLRLLPRTPTLLRILGTPLTAPGARAAHPGINQRHKALAWTGHCIGRPSTSLKQRGSSNSSSDDEPQPRPRLWGRPAAGPERRVLPLQLPAGEDAGHRVVWQGAGAWGRPLAAAAHALGAARLGSRSCSAPALAAKQCVYNPSADT